MGYDIGWIIPRLRSPGALWSCASSITVAVVGLFSKLIVELLNKTTVYNREALLRATGARPPGVALLTVSNHHSCFDDPGLWGVLETGVLLRGSRMRWSLAAHDICFTRAIHSAFFALGKCVPVVRGAGVYQEAMDFCEERLRRGEWVHIFPEGRVNVSKEHIRLKWGVGRLVAGCVGPAPRLVAGCVGPAPRLVVLPLWHEGMDRVLPNREPYLLSFRKRVFLNVGEPIQIHHLLDRLRSENASEEETRRVITERIQEELVRLRDTTHRLMRAALGTAADLYLADRTDVLVTPPPPLHRTTQGDKREDAHAEKPRLNGKHSAHLERDEDKENRHDNHIADTDRAYSEGLRKRMSRADSDENSKDRGREKDS